MADKILVFLEQRNGQIKKSSFETVKAGQLLSEKTGGEIVAVLAGGDVENIESAGGYGAGKVVHFKNNDLVNYSPSAYTKIVTEFAKEIDAKIILFSNTAMGKDLAPRVCARLDCGIAMDCIEFNFEGSDIVATRPVFAGKALIDVKLTSDRKIFTTRPNVFNAGTPGDNKAEVEVRNVDNPDLATRVVEIKQAGGKLDVAEADIIVSGGRGLKDAENFKLVEELAQTLGAATGASRAVVDAGWRPHSEQVGQTGKTVSPSLYIALGISGAIQHLAGMRSSKYIVAVNKDKDAPIFQVADYGIAGDVFDVVPAMIEEIKKIKEN